MSLCVWNLVVKLNYSKYIVEVSRFRRFCTAPCNYPFLAIIRSARRTEVGVPRIVYARNSTHGYKKSSVSKYLYNGLAAAWRSLSILAIVSSVIRSASANAASSASTHSLSNLSAVSTHSKYYLFSPSLSSPFIIISPPKILFRVPKSILKPIDILQFKVNLFLSFLFVVISSLISSSIEEIEFIILSKSSS